MKTKICGITNLTDALCAVECGADVLGFNFYPKSPRYITPLECTRIILELPAHIETVGVFVNLPPEQVLTTMEECGLHLAQLSGDEPWSDLMTLGHRAYKAMRVREPENALAQLAAMPARDLPPYCMIDANLPGQYGGTGQVADWSLAAKMARQVPILLAGGLTPENVGAAVEQVHPWGVDVASGVETSPGKKDPMKIGEFIQKAIEAVQRIEKGNNKLL